MEINLMQFCFTIDTILIIITKFKIYNKLFFIYCRKAYVYCKLFYVICRSVTSPIPIHLDRYNYYTTPLERYIERSIFSEFYFKELPL